MYDNMKDLFSNGKLPVLLLVLCLSISGCTCTHYLKQKGKYVTLYLKQPHADNVVFISSLDRYKSHATNLDDQGFWKVSVPNNQEFEYCYIVDGVVKLPDCKVKVSDDFGTMNCLFPLRL